MSTPNTSDSLPRENSLCLAHHLLNFSLLFTIHFLIELGFSPARAGGVPTFGGG
jgi:hypothetical protein